jgi:hypothetical protein
VRTSTHRSKALYGRLVEHAPRDLPQLAARDKVVHLSRRDPETLSGLGDGKKTHNR